ASDLPPALPWRRAAATAGVVAAGADGFAGSAVPGSGVAAGAGLRGGMPAGFQRGIQRPAVGDSAAVVRVQPSLPVKGRDRLPIGAQRRETRFGEGDQFHGGSRTRWVLAAPRRRGAPEGPPNLDAAHLFRAGTGYLLGALPDLLHP